MVRRYTSKADTRNVLLIKHLEAARFSDNCYRRVEEYQLWIYDITDDFCNIDADNLVDRLGKLGLW